MRLAHIVDALRHGAVIRCGFVKGEAKWELHDGIAIKTVSSRAVQSLQRRKAIVPCGDAFFPGSVPAQTWVFTSDAQLLAGLLRTLEGTP
jgi:hypothetical protein